MSEQLQDGRLSNVMDSSPRGRLLAAAAHLFRVQGYDRTTVRDIAAEVGIQSGSIFHHFKSKDDILFAVMMEVIRFNTERLNRAVDSSVSTEDKLRALIHEELVSINGDTSEAMGVLVYEWRCLPLGRQKEALEARSIYDQIWQDVLEAAKDEGVTDKDPQLLRHLVRGMNSWTVSWFDSKGKLSLDELTQQIFSMVCR